jgi:dephospho-CoA kinase
MRQSYRIGLTGNIATGKTTVGHMLEALGAVWIDADKVAHKVMEPGGKAFPDVTQAFGPAIIGPDGTIDRRKLGEHVFSDPAALRQLESLVHPAVIEAVEHQIALSDAPVVVVEAIKLLESGMAASYEAIWVTVCAEVTQVTRLMESRGLSREAALQRIRAQPPQSHKMAAADLVIRTDGPLEATRAQVEVAWADLCASLSPSHETQNL